MTVQREDRLLTPAVVGGRSASNVVNGAISPVLAAALQPAVSLVGVVPEILCCLLFFRHFVFLVGSCNKSLLSHFAVLFSFVVPLYHFLLFSDLQGGRGEGGGGAALCPKFRTLFGARGQRRGMCLVRLVFKLLF